MLNLQTTPRECLLSSIIALGRSHDRLLFLVYKKNPTSFQTMLINWLMLLALMIALPLVKQRKQENEKYNKNKQRDCGD